MSYISSIDLRVQYRCTGTIHRPFDMKRCLVQRVENLESGRIRDDKDKRAFILRGIN